MKYKPKHQPLLKHQDHEVEIRPSKNAVHFAYYYCLKCHCHISWISKRDAAKVGWSEKQTTSVTQGNRWGKRYWAPHLCCIPATPH
jgi:hypothetical protein